MENLDLRKHSKYFFISSFIGLLILSAVLIKPYITSILGSIILAYIFNPVYKKLLIVTKNKNISAFLVSFFLILLLATPMLFLVNTLLTESTEFFTQLDKIDFSVLEKKYLENIFGGNIEFTAYFKDTLNKLLIKVLQKTDNFILTIPQKFISFALILFMLFYLFKDGDKLVALIKRELPLKPKYKQNLEKRFNETIYATIYGLIVTAFIQGVVATIGLYIFGAPSPLLFGMLMIILAMLPYLGAAIVWLPISVIKFITGDVFNGVGLFIYGLLIVSTIDNVFRSYLIGSKANIHPVLVLLGVLGGLKIFGIIGIIIGPLTLAILVVFIELYISEYKVNGTKKVR